MRQALHQWLEHGVDEHRLAVEHVHGRVGDFAVHQERHADFGHRFQRRHRVVHVTHAGVGVGCGAGRVQLDAVHETAFLGLAYLVGAGGFGQVQRHQRLEVAAGRTRGQDALAVGGGGLDGGHRRFQVGHDDGAAHLATGIRQHRRQRLAITDVQVPVVGAGNGQLHGKTFLE
ncbi:hypothetical protein D3C72_1789860 [compost metagenome]